MSTGRIPSWKLALVAGTFVLAAPLPAAAAARFVRGNVDQDRTVAMSDAIQVLNHLFLGGATPACLDAADVDDSGDLGITDAVRLLVFLFTGGAPPASPYPECGEDTTAGPGCATFLGCEGSSATGIAGRTVDQDGAPAAGAKVSGGSRIAYSGPDGAFELADLRGGPRIRVLASLGQKSGESNVFHQGPGRLDIGDIVLEPPSGPGACGNSVARALEHGCGRVFAWGDEHVLFDEYLPGSSSFWRNALGWLAGNPCGGAPRSRIGITRFRSDVESVITDMGFTLADFHPGEALDDFDILVVEASFFPAPAAGALRDWVEGGGALMTLAGGIGDSYPQECDSANQWTSPFGILYDCAHAAPWGPVSSFEEHAISEGLAASAAPFVNGRYILEDPGTGSDVVARAGECHPAAIPDCRKPAALHDGTPAGGEVVVESDCAQTALITDTDEAAAGAELHIIGIYEARSREVSVRVDREGRHVLALTAYGGDCNGMAGEHHWTVTAGPGATIEKVILSGLEPPTATVPEGTAVETFSAQSWLGVGYGEDCGGGDTPGMISNAEAAAGLKMRSFHGCYEASEFRFAR